MSDKKLREVRDELTQVIKRCERAQYSLDDYHILIALAGTLMEEARLIHQCCT